MANNIENNQTSEEIYDELRYENFSEEDKKGYDAFIENLQNIANTKERIEKVGSNFLKMFSFSSTSRSFDGQVAGHGGIIQLPNGSLIKNTNETELNFYKLIHEKNLPIKKFMPECYNFDPSFEEIKKEYITKNSSSKNEVPFINMQNLCINYKHPNVIDIKLGTRLYDDNADELKRTRMEIMANFSTASENGLIVSAVQVYNRTIQNTVKISKNYGMFLTPDYLAKAILRFFCNIVEPLYGLSDQQKEKELDGSFFEKEPSDYVVGFIKAIIVKVNELKEAVLNSHVVIYGSSICIIYETIDVAKEVEKRCKNPDMYKYPFSFHYIDFAHASVVDPSLGEDKSLMTGFNKLIEIFENYLKSFDKL